MARVHSLLLFLTLFHLACSRSKLDVETKDMQLPKEQERENSLDKDDSIQKNNEKDAAKNNVEIGSQIDSFLAVRLNILDPTDTLVNVPAAVIIQALDLDGHVVTNFASTATLVCSGSATGCGGISFINGVANVAVNDAVEETVQLSLVDSAGTGLDMTSVQDLIFTSASNQLPVLTGIPDESINENAAMTQVDAGDGGDDLDADGQAITYTCYYDQTANNSVAATTACTALTGVSFTGATGVLDWTPSYSQSGTYEFRIIGSDGALTDDEIFVITVANVNQAPSLSAISDESINENAAMTQVDAGDGGDDLDADGQAITYTCYYDQTADNSVAATTACTALTGVSFTGATGVLDWTPSYSQSGTYEFRIIGSDGALTDDEIFVITVANVNQAPSADDITPSAFNEDTASEITLSYTDPETDLGTSCAVSNLTNVTETLACSCDGSGVCKVSVQGTSDYSGAASFTYTVTAGGSASNSATATLSITEVPEVIHTYTMTLDGSNAVTNFRTVLASSNFSKNANSIRVHFVASTVANSVITSASICRRHEASYRCADTPVPLKFATASGVTINMNTATWSDWVDYPIDKNKDYLINIYNSASSLAYRRGSAATGLTYVALGADLTTTQSPNDPWATLTRVILVDSVEGSLDAEAPIAYDLAKVVAADVGTNIALSGVDLNGSSLTYSIVANPSNGDLDATNLPTVVYTPDLAYTGPDSFTYRVNDGTSNSATATVSLTVVGNHRIFLTSTTTQGNFGGLTSGSAFCQARANAASLGGTWRAILSTSVVNAKDFIAIVGVVKNMNNQTIADDATDFWDGTLDTAIDRYEDNTIWPNGGAYHSYTGTFSSGLKETGKTCNDWTDNGGAQVASGLVNHDTPSSVSIYDSGGYWWCDQASRLICIDGQLTP